MKNYKLWLCGITSSGKENELKELIEPVISFFDGLQWVFHYPLDNAWRFLDANKKDGRIVYCHYSCRHGFSMTNYLWQGTMQNGDFFIQIDDLERISPEFVSEWAIPMISYMRECDVSMVANFGKPLLFKYDEELEFRGSPHWFPANLKGKSMNVELPLKYFWNVRDLRRPLFHWVSHYVKYYLFPAGSNSALLGLEKQGDVSELFPKAEKIRLSFREEIKKRGCDLTVDGVEKIFRDGMDDTIRGFVNGSKELNDFYRYKILGDQTVVDSHLLSDMKTI